MVVLIRDISNERTEWVLVVEAVSLWGLLYFAPERFQMATETMRVIYKLNNETYVREETQESYTIPEHLDTSSCQEQFTEQDENDEMTF